MGSSLCYNEMGLKKGQWTPEEDQKLLRYIQQHGHGCWRALPSKAGLQRCGKSCRLRWTNYLRPDIKRGKFSFPEEQTIIQLHALLGNRWSAIASHLPRRTDNEIKNHWHTHLKKRLAKMGIDPTTHKPINVAFVCGQPEDTAKLSHMAQWESARIEAEGRLVRQSKLVSNLHRSHESLNRAPAPPPPPPPPTLTPCLDILKVWSWANPGKDICPKWTLDGHPPTSTLSLSDNVVHIPTVGLSNGISSTTIGNPNHNYQHEVEGTVENSIQLHDQATSLDPIGSANYVADCSLKFPCFWPDVTDLRTTVDAVDHAGHSHDVDGGCWGVDLDQEDKITNYLSSILN